MIKRTVKETTEKFDKDGKLIERITREETETDDETRYPVYPDIPKDYQMPTFVPPYEPTCNSNNPYTINCSSKAKRIENN